MNTTALCVGIEVIIDLTFSTTHPNLILSLKDEIWYEDFTKGNQEFWIILKIRDGFANRVNVKGVANNFPLRHVKLGIILNSCQNIASHLIGVFEDTRVNFGLVRFDLFT